MPGIVDENLAGFTVTYNGVQFGGLDSAYFMTPPMYSFRGIHRWDESRRSVLGIDYTLLLRCIIFDSGLSEISFAADMADIRNRLRQPAKELKIQGMGTGFGVIAAPGAPGASDYWDMSNGPHPLPFECRPLGQMSWEISWGVQFFINECVSPGTPNLAYLAFNFTTTWNNDFEGLTQRTISGHVVIPQIRNHATSKVIAHVAEETRGTIVVAIPDNYQRVTNTWTESMDKSRLDFTIVDEMIGGDHLPPGITAADGSFSFNAGDGKGGFATAICSLTAFLKTAPNQPRNLAGQIFLAAALAKQAAMQAALPEGGVVIPLKISITAGKFASARQTNCSMLWSMTSCLNAMLGAAGIWEPVGDNNQSTWKTSMSALWNNRGFSGITSLASEAVVIDICDSVTARTIGVTGSSPNEPAAASIPSLTCPEIPEGGGWITYELDIRVYRADDHSVHKKATSYVPSIGQIFGADPNTSDDVLLGGPMYSQSGSDNHVIEYHGYPETLIGVRFKGLRFKNKPFMPEIKTIGGMAPILVEQDVPAPRWAFDSFGCPVWFMSGYRVYRVPGYVSDVKSVGSKTSCTETTIPEDY